MTASKILLYFCLSFVVGIFLNSFFQISLPALLAILILGIFLISVFWKYKKFAVIGFCLLFLVVGIWRHQSVEIQISKSKLQIYNDREETITLIGVVVKEADIREKTIKLTIEPEEMKGKILLTTNRYPEYQYGDELKITGYLKTPQEFEDFNYRDYLAKEGIYSVINFPKIELIGKNQGNFIYAKILNFKYKLRESIYQNLSPPQSSILGAVILGDKRKLSEDLKQKLNITGVRHITAVSGMHVVILSGVLMSLLIGLGLWRQQAFYFAIILLLLFIIMVGAPASAIRAGIMGGLFLLAQKVGRLKSASRAIVFAATVMLVQNPLLLKLDVGFQLSFLAVMGIIYLMPIFQYYFLKWFPVEWSSVKTLGGLLSMTLAAQVFTLPILIYNFGYVSLVAPFTNVLVVPLLPYIMISGFIFGLSGIIFLPLGWILSWFSWLLLTYLVKIVDFFSQIPPAYFKISWVWLLIFYLIFGVLIWRLRERQKLKFLNY